MALFLNEHDVEELLTVTDSMDVLEASIREQGQKIATNRPRQIVATPNAQLSVLPAAIPSLGSLGYKTYTVGPDGVRFWLLLFKEDGELHCLMEAEHIGLIRTGGASGIATKYMSREDSKVAGILGTGYQAPSQLEAVCKVRKIEKVLAYSRTTEKLLEFCKGMSKHLGLPVEPAKSVEEVVRKSDVLCTITSSKDPVVDGSWVPEGQHINLVGAMKPTSREIDTLTIERADLIAVDDWQQSHVESGEFIKAVEEGRLDWNRIREFSDVVAEAPKRKPGSISLFKSHGVGLWDIAMASLVYDRAVKRGMGVELPIKQQTKALRRGHSDQVRAWAAS
ncbi:ornithine cyclodeaminase family protein [Ferrovibrio sp. MS7]|jgi:alanine dehydrogenase|uniref:ornithine cyclodeaminase family protein n=1 Tax=Ferrovibrio TaxID=1231242 RepID=UPI003137661B